MYACLVLKFFSGHLLMAALEGQNIVVVYLVMDYFYLSELEKQLSAGTALGGSCGVGLVFLAQSCFAFLRVAL